MQIRIRFTEPRALRDLATLLGRAARIEEAETRLQLHAGVLAVWVPVLRPATLLDDSPLVLGMRAVPAECEQDPGLDAVVPLRAVLDRLARAAGGEAPELPVPPERPLAGWAAVSPPRSGWRPSGRVSEAALAAAAEAGIARIAAAAPRGVGTLIAQRARTETWTAPLAGVEPTDPEEAGAPVPPVAGTAFAADALGFLAPGAAARRGAFARLAEAPGWLRLSTRRGHVLQRRRV